MKQLKLNVTNRSQSGRGASRRLRTAGSVPAVIYGSSGNRSLSLNEREFRMMMRAKGASTALVEITDETGKVSLSLIQDVQRDSLTDHFVHVDFREVFENEEVRVRVPIRFVGEAEGVKLDNALIEIMSHHIAVRALPKKLPEFIEVDITPLRAGQAIHVKHLPAIDGVSYAAAPERVIVACVVPDEEIEGDAAAAPAAAAAAPAAGAAPAADAKAAPAADAKAAKK